jgi:hypothetical protein
VKILADAAPNAVLSLSDTSITRGSSVGADGSASTDVDNTPIASYRFDCGNGMRTAEQSSPRTTCTYPTTGKFTIQLWVTDTAQLTRSVTKSVRVR